MAIKNVLIVDDSATDMHLLSEMLKKNGTPYTFVFHPGAEHGYALPERDIFHKEATERDWEHIFALFHRQIPPVF